MYWDCPDRPLDPPEDRERERAFEKYLSSRDYILDLAEAVEDLIQISPHVFAEFVIDAQADMNLAILMVDPAEFGIRVRDEVEEKLTEHVREDVEQAWINRYDEDRRALH
jgi:predicted choloylglycine hydrolase